MIIKNFQQLATSVVRKIVLNIAEAGLKATDVKTAVSKFFLYNEKKQRLKIREQEFNIAKFEKIICAGLGTGSGEALEEIKKILGEKVSNTVLASANATAELIDLCKENPRAKTLVIFAVCSGADGVLETGTDTNKKIISALAGQGASFTEISTVQKHLGPALGGRLAKAIYPVTCISLIFSGAPGDDISSPASGPTVKDTTTNRDASAILKKYNILELCQLASLPLLETPKEEKYFENTHNIGLVSGRLALEAMAEKCEDLGFEAKILSRHFDGEPKERASKIISSSKKGTCLLGTGEILGNPGSFQQMALAVLPLIHENQVLLCLASENQNSESAGAVMDTSTISRAKALGLEPSVYLGNNNSLAFFDQVGDLVHITGNAQLMDFFVLLEA